jgi:PAS domain-containing protein
MINTAFLQPRTWAQKTTSADSTHDTILKGGNAGTVSQVLFLSEDSGSRRCRSSLVLVNTVRLRSFCRPVSCLGVLTVMKAISGHRRTLIAMALWLGILGGIASWFDSHAQQDERRLALTTANAFYQQIMFGSQWNASHGGVYVPAVTDIKSPPSLKEPPRELTTVNGLRLTRISPGSMARQMAKLTAKSGEKIRVHITSLTPTRPEYKATAWEIRWLHSFVQGAKEQGEFYQEGEGQTPWFRYMAPIIVGRECLRCHEMQGYKEGDLWGGISIALPFPTHTHRDFLAGYGSLAAIGLVFIFIGGTLYERKQLLFDATFNSPVPTCVTAKDHTILMANESYWNEFGPLPTKQKSIKCHEHRPGISCHTDKCPLNRIMSGSEKYVCEPSKEKNGSMQHFISTAKPLLDSRGKLAGVVESFQEITKRKQLEDEKEQLIVELKKSLEQVKLLTGLIPICSSCKKIRDDRGFWSQVESYITRHSEAKFSHGICPDCVRKLYPELSDQILQEIDGNPSGPDMPVTQDRTD